MKLHFLPLTVRVQSSSRLGAALRGALQRAHGDHSRPQRRDRGRDGGLRLAQGALRPPRAPRRARQLDRAQVHPQDRLQRDGRGQGQLRGAALRQAEISGKRSSLKASLAGPTLDFWESLPAM